MSEEPRGGVACRHDGWWIAQVGVDFIRSDVLRHVNDEAALVRWPGILGRYATEQQAESALRSELLRLGAPLNHPAKRVPAPRVGGEARSVHTLIGSLPPPSAPVA